MPAYARPEAPGWFAVQRIGPLALVSIAGEIALSQSADELIAAIGDAARIEVALDSIGGNMAAGLQIFDALHNRDVEVTISRAYSAAIPVALAARRIVMFSNATMMVHEAQQFVFGSADWLECGARRLRTTNARLRDLLICHTEQTAATVDGWLSHDTYFDSRAALEAGLADEITEAPPAPVAEAPALAEPEPGQTDDERLILAMLSAMGDVTVRSKAELARTLNSWLVHTVKELR